MIVYIKADTLNFLQTNVLRDSFWSKSAFKFNCIYYAAVVLCSYIHFEILIQFNLNIAKFYLYKKVGFRELWEFSYKL